MNADQQVLVEKGIDATTYSIDRVDALLLSAIVVCEDAERQNGLRMLMKKRGVDGFISVMSQFVAMANSVVSNNAEMVDLILITSGVSHPDRTADKANLPTLFGALRGVVMADGMDVSKVCGGCAFRLGTPANQSPLTTMEADDCVTDGDQAFLCHEELDRKGNPFRACAGYAQSLKARKE
jgi:hypothetical protein